LQYRFLFNFTNNEVMKYTLGPYLHGHNTEVVLLTSYTFAMFTRVNNMGKINSLCLDMVTVMKCLITRQMLFDLIFKLAFNQSAMPFFPD